MNSKQPRKNNLLKLILAVSIILVAAYLLTFLLSITAWVIKVLIYLSALALVVLLIGLFIKQLRK